MASRTTKGRDARRKASQSAPTSRPSLTAASTTTTSVMPPKRQRRWVNPGSPPMLVEMSNEELWDHARVRGITKEQFPKWKSEFMVELARMDAETGPPIGVKPVRGGPNVLKIEIPGTSLLVRLWDGGVESMGQYLLDFFDREADEPINTYHAGISVFPVYYPGIMTYSGVDGKLTSMEQAFGYKVEDISYGNEKFIVKEGSRWRLVRDGAEDFFFVVPFRPLSSKFHNFVKFED